MTFVIVTTCVPRGQRDQSVIHFVFDNGRHIVGNHVTTLN